MEKIGDNKLTASEYQDHIRTNLVQIAEAILSDNIDLVSGCRKLESLYYELRPTSPRFNISIKAFVSETDRYPIGEVRTRYQESYLQSLDEQLAIYSERMKAQVFKACKEIIQEFTACSALPPDLSPVQPRT